MHLGDPLAFRARSDGAVARGHKCLTALTAPRYRPRGPSTSTALYLIQIALFPKLLWASPVWWAGSQHILHRLEPVYRRALGVRPAPVHSKILLFLLTRSPPLHCVLDRLPACYVIRPLFAADNDPLRQYIHLASRTVQQSWLVEMKIAQKTAVTHPTLRRPLSLVARYLDAGDVLEDLGTTGPSPHSR